MYDIDDQDFEVPTLCVSPDVYDAILLAERVAVVTEGAARRLSRHAALRAFLKIRSCTVPASGTAASPACDSPGLLRLMVGG